MTGHLLGGAGGIESVFTALAIHHQVSPPTMNIFNQDSECDLDFAANEAKEINIKAALQIILVLVEQTVALIFKEFKKYLLN